MKKIIIFTILLSLMFAGLCFSKTPKEYEAELKDVKILLSVNDPDQVRDWLLDKPSGFPDLADKLLSLLKGRKPQGTETVLDAIMGKLRIAYGVSTDTYIAPPYDIEKLREAYVRNWKERNIAAWGSLPAKIKENYKNAFDCITNPLKK